MYSTSISTSSSFLSYAGYAVEIIAVFVIAIAIYKYSAGKKNNNQGSLSKVIPVILILVIIGIPLITIGDTSGGGSSINIGPHYIAINGQFIGSKNYTSTQVKYAFTENINSGNLTISNRNEGTSLGSLNEGLFTLSNGQSAYIIDVNATVLVVQLQNGVALVLGSSNTTALVAAFNEYVYPVS